MVAFTEGVVMSDIPQANNYERAGRRRVTSLVPESPPDRTSAQYERKKADPQAVERRRLSRQYKFNKDSDRRRLRDQDRRSRQSLEDAFRIAERAIQMEQARYMCRKFLRGGLPSDGDIRELPEYWLLRRFGYDVRSKEYTHLKRPDGTLYFISPFETAIWKWWTTGDPALLVKQIFEGRTTIVAMRKLIVEEYPSNLPTTVADADSARRKYAKLIAERNRVIPL